MSVAALQAQQKGQYVPGQFGLNAGVVPASGLTYANVALNYSASSLNDANGNHRPNVVGTYGFWADENVFYFVPKKKIWGASFAPYISLNVANGSPVADISGTNLGATGEDQDLETCLSSPSISAGTSSGQTSSPATRSSPLPDASLLVRATT